MSPHNGIISSRESDGNELSQFTRLLEQDGLGDPGQRVLRLPAREARRRVVHQTADLARSQWLHHLKWT